MGRWLSHNHQTLTALGAMLVGVAALFVAWDQARVMRAQQHGAVFPVLQVDGFLQTTSERRSIGLRVENHGVGPALVRSVRLTRDGAEASIEDLRRLYRFLPAGADQSWSSMNGRAIAPGGSVEPVAFGWPRAAMDDAVLIALLAEWEHWEADVCYCSVFERCWTASTERNASSERRRCAADTPDIFEEFGLSGQANGAAAPAETASPEQD